MEFTGSKDWVAWISALKTADLRKLAGASAGAAPVLAPEPWCPMRWPRSAAPSPGNGSWSASSLREERRRKREALLQATERVLERIEAQVRAGTLRGQAKIRVSARPTNQKHFEITIGNGFTRKNPCD